MLAALVLAAALSPAAFQVGGSPQERFQEAVAAYRSGDYDTATSLWRRLLEGRAEGLDPALVCYDLGNAAFRRERVLEAAGWYTAALRLDPRHADAWANLELARERAGLDPADRGDLVDTLRRLGSALTLAELEWALVALCATLLAVLLVEAVLGGVALRRTAWALGVAALMFTALWVWRLGSAGGAGLFVTEIGGATLRSEPHVAAAAIGRAEPAERVERVDELPGWVRVRARGGVDGWVEAAHVLALPEAGDGR